MSRHCGGPRARRSVPTGGHFPQRCPESQRPLLPSVGPSRSSGTDGLFANLAGAQVLFPGVARGMEPACPISRDTVTGRAGFRA